PTTSCPGRCQTTPPPPASIPITHWTASRSRLAAGMIVPVQGGWIDMVGGQQTAGQQPVGVSGKRVRLQVLPSANAHFTPVNSTASLNVADNQVFLVDAFPPVEPPGGAPPLWSVLTTSNVAGSLAVADDDHIKLLPADKKDPVASEAAVVSTVASAATVVSTLVPGDVTTLGLQSALARIYDATTVTVNANAVEATNGETVHEILGSG